ncbi:MAG: DNA mismatch repair endonuclease MutL [Bacteroidales bacterium]|nr:DNA mismatch repair endonuclease MutL [Bacteroidales bacterium]
MGKLQVLPARTANMIAAGEVVQRPASVVKELLENAVDAGAGKISVVITDAGRTLLQVIDDGCGMSPSDAVLCFERHATSKIATPEDLEKIATYGFRGEALASIAAVSQVTLRTRRPQDETAVQVTISGTEEIRTSAVAAPVGSNFAVRNLFYNTPARRKFLKSDAMELKHIVAEFTRVALPHPEIEFSLSHNGRDLYVLPKAKSLKFRVLDLFGKALADELVDVGAETSIVSVGGFAGKPDSARKTPGNQFFFADGRYFRSPYLHKAVMKAYEEFIPEGVTPSYFIFLKMGDGAMDVNIHPTKTEIKFEDDNVIFQIVYACVRETLSRNNFGASLDFEAGGGVQIPELGQSFEEYRGGLEIPSAPVDPTFNPFETASPGADGGFSGHDGDFPGTGTDSSMHAGGSGRQPGSSYANGGLSARKDDYGVLFQTPAEQRPAFTVQGRFIVARSASGMMVIHVRRAWERVLYERFLGAVSGGGHVSQAALFPVQIRVGVEQRLLFEENAGLLESLGFDITPIGTDTVAVGGVPEGCSCETGRIESLIGDVALILSDSHNSLEDIMNQRIAEKFAMLGAMNAEAPDSPQAALRLVDALFATGNSEFTPGGRRIVALMPVSELEKLF